MTDISKDIEVWYGPAPIGLPVLEAGEPVLRVKGLPADFDPHNHHSLIPALERVAWCWDGTGPQEMVVLFDEAVVYHAPGRVEARAFSLEALIAALEDIA